MQDTLKMKMLKKNNNNRKLSLINNVYLATTAATIIFTLTIIFPSVTITPVSASTTGNDTTTPSSGLELSAQPVWVEHAAITGVTPINETHSSVTYSGNGTLTLPNTTQSINTTSNGSALVSIATESGQGKVTIRTQDGEETATVTFYEIDRHPDITTGEGKGIVIAVINTNTTSGMLAPLNGMILVGINEFQTSTAEGRFTLWEWNS
jgi:hypothetical protein